MPTDNQKGTTMTIIATRPLEEGDVVRCASSDRSNYLAQGMVMRVTTPVRNGRCSVEGRDTASDWDCWTIIENSDGEWYIEDTSVRVTPWSFTFKKGMKVVVEADQVSDALGDDHDFSNESATVISGPDSDEEWYVTMDNVKDSDGDPMSFYVTFQGLITTAATGGVHPRQDLDDDQTDSVVTTVTNTSVGNTTVLSDKLEVVVDGPGVMDNNAKPIDGLKARVYNRLTAENSSVHKGSHVTKNVDGGTWWVNIAQANDGNGDGFWADDNGVAVSFNGLRAVDPRATAASTSTSGALKALMDAEFNRMKHDERAQRNEAADTTPESVRSEYGHRSPDGTVYPWEPEHGPYSSQPVKINDVTCIPVTRRVVTYGWVELG